MAKLESIIDHFSEALGRFFLNLECGEPHQQQAFSKLVALPTFDTQGLKFLVCGTNVDQNLVELSAEQLLKLQNDGRFALDSISLYLRKEELKSEDVSLVNQAVQDILGAKG